MEQGNVCQRLERHLLTIHWGGGTSETQRRGRSLCPWFVRVCGQLVFGQNGKRFPICSTTCIFFGHAHPLRLPPRVCQQLFFFLFISTTISDCAVQEWTAAPYPRSQATPFVSYPTPGLTARASHLSHRAQMPHPPPQPRSTTVAWGVPSPRRVTPS